MTFFNHLSGSQNGTRQCHFSLHLYLSASFFFVHLDPTLVQCVHNAQHNSAHRKLSRPVQPGLEEGVSMAEGLEMDDL